MSWKPELEVLERRNPSCTRPLVESQLGPKRRGFRP